MEEEDDVSGNMVGYVRVSTDDQSGAMQRQALVAAGVHPDLICEDIESGWTSGKSRPGLRLALRLAQRGATLVVWKLDRLGRNTAELILTVHRLHERGVMFRSLTQSEINTASMQNPTGRLIFHLFCALAQFESDQLSERTRAGMEAAKARGVRFGRKTFHELYVETGMVAKFQALRREGVPVKTALREVDIPRTTYNKWQLIMEPPVPVDDLGDGVGLPAGATI